MSLFEGDRLEELIRELQSTYESGNPETRDITAILVLHTFQQSKVLTPEQAARALAEVMGDRVFLLEAAEDAQRVLVDRPELGNTLQGLIEDLSQMKPRH